MLDPRNRKPAHRGSIPRLSQEEAEVALFLALAFFPQGSDISRCPQSGAFALVTNRGLVIQAQVSVDMDSLSIQWDLSGVPDSKLSEAAAIREHTTALLPICIESLKSKEIV